MSFWSRRAHALALVELLRIGQLPRRVAQEEAFAALRELGWCRLATRQEVLELDPRHSAAIQSTLAGAWPSWRKELARLEAAGLPPTPVGWRELERQDRLDAVDESTLPERMNRRTAAATIARNAKARLGPFERIILDEVDVTDDGLVRMRPSTGLAICRGGDVRDARDLAGLLGEVSITDRALRDGTVLAGDRPRAVLTVENLGAYQDLVVPADVLVLHVPGWNTRTTKALLRAMSDVPVIHFGDLDPNGVAIVEHLRRWRPSVAWLVPPFWEDYVGRHALRKDWPGIPMPADAPAWVRDLPQRGEWLEQEVVAIDPRMREFLEATVVAAAIALAQPGANLSPPPPPAAAAHARS
jgi:hypothetical protein